MLPLSGRHALVTGGNRGIGRACAAALTAAGAKVTVTGRDLAALEDTVRGGDAAAFEICDVTSAASVEVSTRHAVERLGRIDILVANAGAASARSFLNTTDESFQQMFDLNVLGVARAMRLVLPGMVQAGFGRVVAVASVAGLRGLVNGAAYCAAKHAVVGLVRSAACEMADKGVTINAVCPHFTETDLLRKSVETASARTGKTYDEMLARFVDLLPIKRLISPDEVAAAVMYLCSPQAGAVTGLALPISGGDG